MNETASFGTGCSCSANGSNRRVGALTLGVSLQVQFALER